MADLDTMLGALRAAGRHETTGGFTLDAAKAREKLREFQLADPTRYVLLLVQALVLRGATQIDIETDADDLKILGKGAHPFTRDELGDLYVLLFDEGPPRPGVREVALALNAAMALDPRWVRLECAGADGNGVRLEQRNDAPDRLEPIIGTTPGISVHVRERFKAAHFVRFLTRGGHGKERAHVLQRSVFAGLPITLDGKPIVGRMPDASVSTWHRVALGARDVGILGLATGGAGQIALVRNQVWISSDISDLPDLVGVRAVVDVSHLRTDASVSDVVRDELWTEVIAAVRGARDIALAEVARRCASIPDTLVDLRGVLCLRLAHHRELNHDPTSAQYCDYLAVRLWRTMIGTDHTSAELLARERITYTTSNARPVPPGFDDALHVQGPEVGDLLAVFGAARIADVTFDLHRAATRENNRRAFLTRVHDGRLPPGNNYRHTASIDRADLRGTVGYRPNAGPSSIRLVLDGCLLADVSIALRLSTIHAVIHGKFTPSALFDNVEHDDVFAEAIHATLSAYAWIVDAECAGFSNELPPRDIIQEIFDYIIDVMDGTHAIRVLESVGFVGTAAAEIVQRHGAPWREPFTRGGPTKIGHPFARLPWFEDGAGTPISLTQILDTIGPTAPVPVVTFSRPRLQHPPSLVVRVDATRLKLLEHLLGAARVRKVGSEFEGWLARERFGASPRDGAPALDPTATALEVDFEHADRPGSITLLNSTDAPAPWVVLVDGRSVTQVAPPDLRGVTGRIELDAAHLNNRCDGLTDKGKREAVAAVSAGLAALIEALIVLPSHDERTAALFVDLLRLACPPLFAPLWHELARNESTADAVETYCRVLALGGEFEPARVVKAITGALAKRSGFDIDDVVGDLASARASRSPWADHRVTVAAALPRLCAVPCLPAGGGLRLPLSQLFHAFDSNQPARYLPTGIDVPAELDGMMRLDPQNLMRLREVFGPSRLVDDSWRVASSARRAAFSARPQLPALELAPNTALATIVVAIDGLVGMLGVPRNPPQGHPGKVVVCNNRRTIGEIDPVEGTPWIGIIDGTELGQETDFEALTRREIEWIARVLDNHRPAMIDALCTAGFRDADGALRRQWVHHLVRHVMGRHEHTQPAFDDAGIGEVVDAPMFLDAGGAVLTLRDVRARFGSEQRVAFVRREGLVPGIPAVLVRDDDEEALLRHLFETVEDVETLATSRIAFMQRTASAPKLPVAPDDAIVTETIDAREMQGALWLPAVFVASPTIAIGPQGRAIDEWEGSAMFPCCGGVGGEGIEITDDFTGCTLSRARADHLKSRATKLYVRIVRMLPSDGLAADDPRLPWLRALLERLHEIQAAGRSWPSHDMRALYRDLRNIPLVQLPNGRLVSWTSAERAALPELPQASSDPMDIEDAPPSESSMSAAITTEVVSSAPAPAAVPVASPATSILAPTPSTDAPNPPSIVPAPASIEPTPTPVDPAPAPIEPPRPPPSQRLRDAVLAELRLLHGRAASVLAETCLEAIRIEYGSGRRIASAESSTGAVIDSKHPVVARAMADDADPLLISLVASAALTALNVALTEIADTDEALLVRLHANHLTTARSPTS